VFFTNEILVHFIIKNSTKQLNFILIPDCSCQLQCPNGAIKFQDYNCYQEIKNAVPQGDGAAACSTSLEGSKLVSIKYEAEQEVLVQLLEGRSFWTSGKRVESSSDFQWEDGTLASLGIWDEGEPGNEPGRDCLLVATNGKWKAVACDQPEFLMCQSQLSWNEDKLQDVLISLRHGLVGKERTAISLLLQLFVICKALLLILNFIYFISCRPKQTATCSNN